MLDASPKTERRRFPRCTARRGSFVVWDEQAGRIGKIVDISRHGLSCFCSATNLPDNKTTISLVGYYESLGPIILRDIALDSISTVTAPGGPGGRDDILLRLCFGRLTPSQIAQLSAYLWFNGAHRTAPSLTAWN